MKKLASIATGAALLGLLAASPASAHNEAESKINLKNALNATTSASGTISLKAHHTSLLGKVTAISGNTLTVSGRDKSWTINITGSTTLRSLGMTKVALGQTRVGDKVLVKGIVDANNKTLITAQSIQNLSLHIFRVTLKGIVSNLNTVTRGFTLTLGNNKVVNVTLAPEAKFEFKNGSSTASSSFANIQNGTAVSVTGLLDRDSTTLNGLVVKGISSTSLSVRKDDGKLEAKHDILENLKEGKMDIKSFLKNIFH